MKKKNKGFTLIELLAIIVILAIIAVITVPIILDVIDNAKKGAIKDSAYGYKDAVNKYYVSELYNNQNIKFNGDYTITDKGELSDGTNTYPIQVSGTTPSGGNLTFENNMLKNGCITIDEYKATIENGEVTTVEKGSCGEAEIAYKCIRATELHEKTCENIDACAYKAYGALYDIGDTIEYGNKGTKGEDPVSGDAFDCDVNGDETYDSETERFYYVSDLYDSKIEGEDKFNHDVAVLLYYNNTVDGLPNNSTGVAYDNTHGSGPVDGENWQGPITPVLHLPTVEQWKNITLYNNTRAILTETGSNLMTNGETLPTNFVYKKDNVSLATRLLTTQELEKGCNTNVYDTGSSYNLGQLQIYCEYMLENTAYETNKKMNFFLETPNSKNTNSVWAVDGNTRAARNSVSASSSALGIRPVIEVEKVDIDY